MVMSNWLVQNRQWVFSGVGVSAIAGLLWVIRRLSSRNNQLPVPANHVTQSASINFSPTINLSQELKSPDAAKQEPAPVVLAKVTARPNLRAEGDRITKNICLQGDIWTLDRGVQGREKPFRALLLDVANAPTESRNIQSVCVKAVLLIQSKTYSPLPWVEEYTNAVWIGRADRKTVVLAVGEDRPMGSWYFVLDHRSDPYSVNSPSRMDFTHLAPITSGLPLEVQLIDVNSGELVARFHYLWTFDTTLNFAILKVPSNTE